SRRPKNLMRPSRRPRKRPSLITSLTTSLIRRRRQRRSRQQKSAGETGAFRIRYRIGSLLDGVTAALQRHLRVERGVTMMGLQHHDDGADLYPVIEVDRVLVGQADT